MPATSTEWVSCWAGPRSPGRRSSQVSGAADIAALFAKTTRRYPDTGTPRTRHLVLNPIVEVDGQPPRPPARRSASCRQTETGALQPIVVGRYLDSIQLRR